MVRVKIITSNRIAFVFLFLATLFSTINFDIFLIKPSLILAVPEKPARLHNGGENVVV